MTRAKYLLSAMGSTGAPTLTTPFYEQSDAFAITSGQKIAGQIASDRYYIFILAREDGSQVATWTTELQPVVKNLRIVT